MSRLILYRAFGSPPARAALMLSELIGVQPEIKEVNVLKMENRTPEFKKLNPMGTVPVLQDGDFVVSDSNAIMMYLLGKYGGDKREVLYPSELRTRALVDQTLFFNVGVFYPPFLNILRAAMHPNGTAIGPTPEEVKSVEHAYSVLDAYLQDKQYVAANHLTIADLAAGTTAIAGQGILKVDPQKYPRCAAWLARLQEEHVFKTINAPGAAFITKLLTKLWEKNKLKNKQ